MERLSLHVHDPEEYEGKLLVHQGCEYVVGPHLGTGAERVTHKLINRASGLCLHVLKVWRRAELGYTPSDIRAKLAAGSDSEFNFAQIVPVSIEIDLPGGKAELQIYVGGAPDAPVAGDAQTDQGDQLLKASKFSAACEAYKRALEENPRHTHALLNLASAHAQMKQPGEAYVLAVRARGIEPNYPLYHRACIEYAAAQSLAYTAIEEFRFSKECFPNFFDFDDVGAQLYLTCGFPQEALGCAENCILGKDQKAQLISKCHQAISAKANAKPLIQKAESSLQTSEPAAIAGILERAYAIDPNDPVLAINYGFTLARAGRSWDAMPLLMRGIFHGPPIWTKTCYANAAFCAIDSGKLDQAMLLLEITMSQFDMELRGAELKNLAADLPGRGIWIHGGSIQEERLDSASLLVQKAAQQYGKQAPIATDAARLIKLYAKAMEQPH